MSNATSSIEKHAEIVNEIIDTIGGCDGPFTVYAERLFSMHYPETVGGLYTMGGTDSAITTAAIAAEFISKHPDAKLYIRDDRDGRTIFENNI